MNKLLIALLLLASCHRVTDDIEPKIDYCVQEHYLKALPSPFKPLSESERDQDWGREARIGFGFARELDLYQAMTALKRADMLLPPDMKERKLEIQYGILLCYYFGKRYTDATYFYEHSSLTKADPSFPAFQDLLVVLYDSYAQAGDDRQAARMLEFIGQLYPEIYQKLNLSAHLKEGDLCKVRELAPDHPYLGDFLCNYETQKKSVASAQWFNALLPGAGYLYLGQKQSALTAFLLNGLFIAASYEFFAHHKPAAGAIFASFEAGWYFGGIYGAGQEAKFYNERIYECLATPLMNQKGLFPVLTLRYAF